MCREPHRDVSVLEPEVDFVAWLDAEAITQLLRDDDLTLRADAMSHTGKYNLVATDRS